MKKRNLIATVIVLIAIFSSCKKCITECNLIPAKIIRHDCDRVIFQLLTTDNIGDANWTDTRTGIHYSNVVAYSNVCAISELSNGTVLETLYVSPVILKDRVINPNCYHCQAISDNPPLTNVDFLDISITPCTNNQSK